MSVDSKKIEEQIGLVCSRTYDRLEEITFEVDPTHGQPKMTREEGLTKSRECVIDCVNILTSLYEQVDEETVKNSEILHNAKADLNYFKRVLDKYDAEIETFEKSSD